MDALWTLYLSTHGDSVKVKNRRDSVPLLKGTLDLLVLKALSLGPSHGYRIQSWLEAQATDDIALEDSALYQALHRLEGKRLVTAEWGLTENNRRARFYTLTGEGRAHLESEADTWERYARWVGEVLASGGAP